MDNLGIETETLELKENTTELEKGIISLTAMLNKCGFGAVLFGVKNNGDIIGQDVGKNTLRSVTQAVNNFVDPSVIPTVEVLTSSDGRKYISMKACGNNRPYACRGAIYIRSGEEDRRVPVSELRMMFMSSGDNLINSTSNDQELTFRELAGVLEDKGIAHVNNRNLLKSLELINTEGRFNIQGQLLSDQNPAVITVSIFSGTDRTVISHRTDFSGHCLLKEVVRSLEYVESLNETSVMVGSGIRRECKLFNMDAFKEAWINACVHNNWLNYTPPSIHIFDDKLEVISYGPKPYWLSDEEFFSGRSYPVNESLMKLFVRTGLSEHTGHGIPIIVECYGRNVIKMSNSGIIVTIPFSKERASASIRNGTLELTEAEKAILETLKVYPHCTLSDVAGTTALSRSYVGKAAVKLKKLGLLERIGSNKNGVWKVRDDTMQGFR